MMPAKYPKLDADNFGDLISDFWGYFNIATLPPISTQSEWWKRLSSYLQADVDAAFGKMKDDLDNVPRNLPKAVKKFLSMVWAERGQLGVKDLKDYGECSECNGSGFFMVKAWLQLHRRWYVLQIFCATCGNWQNHVNDPGLITRKTLEQCQYDYAAVKPGNQVLMNPVPVQTHGSTSQIYQLAGDVGKDMPGSKPGARALSAREKKDFIARYEGK